MPSWKKNALVCLATLIAAIAPSGAWAQFGLTPTDGVRLPDSSITNRDDALALELNPAGLAFIQGFDAELVYTSLDNDALAGAGVFLGYGLSPVGFGMAVQYVDNPLFGGDFKKFTLGFAGELGSRLSFGLGFNYFDSDLDFAVDTFSSWDAGVQIRLAEFLGLAASVRDFNTPTLGTTVIDPRYIVGAALRFDEGRYLIEFDGIYNDYGDDWFLRNRLSFEPLDGIRLFTELQTQAVEDFGISSLQAGLAYAIGPTEVTASVIAGFEDEFDFIGTSASVRAISQPVRTFMEPTGFMASLTLRGSLPERGQSHFLFGSQSSFLDLLLYLDALAEDDQTSGIVLTLESLQFGVGQHWELRQALARLREAGKRVIVHLRTADFGELYLASVADEVFISPATQLETYGLSLRLTYLGELFENIHVQPEFVRIAEYKSSPEMFTETAPSEQTLEANNAYLDDVFDHMLASIAEGRNLDPRVVHELLELAPVPPDQAVELGFVDGVLFPDELEDQLNSSGIHVIEGFDPRGGRDYQWIDPPVIAVVYIDGSIVSGGSGDFPIVGRMAGHSTLIPTIEQLSQSSNVRAIVLRVDSPGGSAFASEEIWRAIELADERVPVVVSMGDIAASGGYYVAAAGSEIFATDLTLTGSIGIFSGHFAAQELLETLGIHRYPLTRGPNNNILGFDEPWTDSQRDAVTRSITYTYGIFLQRVADSRGVEPDDIDPIARGRIWSGIRALDNGLVDTCGGLLDAIERARELGGIDPDEAFQIIQVPEMGLFGFLSAVMGQADGSDITPELLEPLEAILDVFGLDQVIRYSILYGNGRPAAAMEFELEGLE